MCYIVSDEECFKISKQLDNICKQINKNGYVCAEDIIDNAPMFLDCLLKLKIDCLSCGESLSQENKNGKCDKLYCRLHNKYVDEEYFCKDYN